MSAPTIVAVNSANGGLGGGTITKSYGAVVAGDLIIVVGRSRATDTAINTPSGWTQASSMVLGGIRRQIFWHIVVSADSFGTFSFSGPTANRWNIAAINWRGADTAHPIYNLATNTDQTASAYPASFPAPSIAGLNNCVLWCSYTWRNGTFATQPAAPTGMTLDMAGSNNDGVNSLSFGEYIKTLTGAGATGAQTLTVAAGNMSGGSYIESISDAFLVVGVGAITGRWEIGRLGFGK